MTLNLKNKDSAFAEGFQCPPGLFLQGTGLVGDTGVTRAVPCTISCQKDDSSGSVAQEYRTLKLKKHE